MGDEENVRTLIKEILRAREGERTRCGGAARSDRNNADFRGGRMRKNGAAEHTSQRIETETEGERLLRFESLYNSIHLFADGAETEKLKGAHKKAIGKERMKDGRRGGKKGGERRRRGWQGEWVKRGRGRGKDCR